MITPDQLLLAIKKRIEVYNKIDSPINKRATQVCPLLESRNQILAEYIISPFSIPRQNVSAMDGYAIATSSTLSKASSIEIVGESQAGSPFSGTVKKDQGIRIFTGAVVPINCNTVIMQEDTNFEFIKDNIDKTQPYEIILAKAADIDVNIRKKGEEIQQNELILQQGKRLNPTDISLLANLGIDKVKVFEPLIVGILATGDELVALGDKLKDSAQIYNSNTPTLKSMLAQLPIIIHDYGIVPDDLDKTIKVVNKAIQKCDVLISTAGVSVGDYDFLTTVIEQLGQINHYKVAMKPGKPFVFGELLGDKNKKLDKPVVYFGLPGNPLSTVVGSLQFVIPALWQMVGAAPQERPMQL
tara:strand:+ start:21005 stop:22072 length:1068 start_codon:yes stop_codon:yes gene_type:complete